MLSSTMTCWIQVAIFPDASVTVHVTIVVPNGKIEGASLATVEPEQLSVKDGIPKATPEAVHSPI